MRQFDKGFIQGYICALSCIVNSHGEDTAVVDALVCSGITKADMVKSGCEQSDIDVLESTIEEAERL